MAPFLLPPPPQPLPTPDFEKVRIYLSLWNSSRIIAIIICNGQPCLILFSFFLRILELTLAWNVYLKETEEERNICKFNREMYSKKRIWILNFWWTCLWKYFLVERKNIAIEYISFFRFQSRGMNVSFLPRLKEDGAKARIESMSVNRINRSDYPGIRENG